MHMAVSLTSSERLRVYRCAYFFEFVRVLSLCKGIATALGGANATPRSPRRLETRCTNHMNPTHEHLLKDKRYSGL